MKKAVLLSTLAVLFVCAPPGWATVYLWDDEDGVLHMVDDLHKVPEAYRDRVKTVETKPQPPSPPPLAPEEKALPLTGPDDEMFGDYPLGWWKKTIDLKKRELNEARRAYKEKEDFAEVYEKGRRLGQIYEADQTERYERFKSELPSDEKRIETLGKEMGELLSKARNAGVPKAVRGE